MKTIHLLIKGKVQGVFYRASAREKADLLGLKGWVKNTSEGDVEAVISGEEPEVTEFIEWCKKGPTLARVTEVVMNEMEEQRFEDFRVIRD